VYGIRTERDGSVGVGDLMARDNNEERRRLFASPNRYHQATCLTGWRFFFFSFFSVAARDKSGNKEIEVRGLCFNNPSLKHRVLPLL
jgi:hypothetical protein